MNRGARHQSIFLDDGDRRTFLYLLEAMSERFAIEFHAYCLMGNHYHLLVRCPEGTLAEAMQYLGSVYTRRFNRKHQVDGALFRGRFLSKAIETEMNLVAVIRYIPRNPLAFLEQHELDSFKWSSHQAYIGSVPTPQWLETKVVLDLFNGRIAGYDSLIREDSCGISDATILDNLHDRHSTVSEQVPEQVPDQLSEQVSEHWSDEGSEVGGGLG